MPNPAFHDIVSEIRRFAERAEDFTSLQEFSVGIIAGRLSYYNWVGFYLLDSSDENVLVLGSFRGAPTEYFRIPVTDGICGAAVAQGETVIVEDVSADPRYLACSLETRSEIIVPILDGEGGRVIGTIDVESERLNAFDSTTQASLEGCARLLKRFWTNLQTAPGA